jgi:hypothetical protein
MIAASQPSSFTFFFFFRIGLEPTTHSQCLAAKDATTSVTCETTTALTFVVSAAFSASF